MKVDKVDFVQSTVRYNKFSCQPRESRLADVSQNTSAYNEL